MNTLIAVNGTLMRGLSLHENITSIGGEFLYETKTEKKYRLYSIDDKYPAMIKDENGESRRVCKDGPVFAIGKVVL